jgi:hypothetical protein
VEQIIRENKNCSENQGSFCCSGAKKANIVFTHERKSGII